MTIKEKPSTGTKRPRSPGEQSCGRCFRMTHKTSKCRHQVVCLRCSGVGHVVARCKLEPHRSPKRKRLHVRTKRSAELEDENRVEPPVLPRLSESRLPLVGHAILSLRLTPEIAAVREELAMVVVLTILSSYVTDAGLNEVLPSVINRALAGPLTPLNDTMYLIPLSSLADVKEVCKLDVAKFEIKDGMCLAKFAPWSAEIGGSEPCIWRRTLGPHLEHTFA